VKPSSRRRIHRCQPTMTPPLPPHVLLPPPISDPCFLWRLVSECGLHFLAFHCLGNMEETFREHSGNIRRTYGGHSGNIHPEVSLPSERRQLLVAKLKEHSPALPQRWCYTSVTQMAANEHSVSHKRQQTSTQCYPSVTQ
jgi:hypothetical protein